MPAGRFVLRSLAFSAPLVGAELGLPEEIAHQARDVLRLHIGETLTLLDGAGGEYVATIIQVTRREVAVTVGARQEGLANPAPPLTLCVGMLKAAKMEMVLQKGTELGVTVFQPLVTERSVALAEELSAAKRRRYEAILAEAMEQSGAAWLPDLREPLPLAEVLAAVPQDAIALIPWERAMEQPLTETLRRAHAPHKQRVWLFIGPEGGFSAAEVELAERHAALPVTLGQRILRAETAALVAVTLALEALGALGSGPGAPSAR
jgi:16S rRNA (uracil1498-N3)-methyltransferase